MRLSTFVLMILSAVGGVFLSPSISRASDRCVVLISLDGLCAYYLDDPKAEIPTLRALMKEGARAASMKASVPSVTWPNHTTLVTGVNPAKHGVVGNVYFDRATLKHVVLIGDPVFDKEQIVRVPTIYDIAKQAGMKTVSIRWPATRNAKTLDWGLPDVIEISRLKQATTPAMIEDLKAAGYWAEVEKAEKTEKDGRWLPPDELVTRVFNLMLQKHRPNLAMLHLIDVDHIQHIRGPRSAEAYAAIKATDSRVREVWETLKKEFGRENATLVIASDHGFSPIRKLILPNVVLRKAKLLNDAGDEEKKPMVRVVPQGGSAFIYILDESRRDEIVKKVRSAFASIEEVAKVVGPEETPAYGVARPSDDPHAPDMLLFAKYGYAFGDTAAGDLAFDEKPERKGTHGHDPAIPELHASFVAWGAGIKPGSKVGEIENTAVAPTIARLLGLSMPDADGKPLDELMTK
jgi:predicted AlkP superfamily pyrophosphatase or phosphodiesterase